MPLVLCNMAEFWDEDQQADHDGRNGSEQYCAGSEVFDDACLNMVLWGHKIYKNLQCGIDQFGYDDQPGGHTNPHPFVGIKSCTASQYQHRNQCNAVYPEVQLGFKPITQTRYGISETLKKS